MAQRFFTGTLTDIASLRRIAAPWQHPPKFRWLPILVTLIVGLALWNLRADLPP